MSQLGAPMSTLASDAFYTEVANQNLGIEYAEVACYALIAYDHLTTLEEEVKYIWNRKFTAVTFLFLFVHFSMVHFLPSTANDSLGIGSLLHLSCLDCWDLA